MSHNLFNDVIYNSIPSNSFDLSHDKKLSMNMGELVPIMVQEVVPGDHFKVLQEQLIRVAPLVSPVMHRVNVSTHFFFVPNRLLWDGWEDYIANPTDPNNPAPFIRFTDNPVQTGNLADYLGYPTGDLKLRQYNALPISAYNFIWNEYYRDQNLQEELPYKLIDGDQANSENLDSIILSSAQGKPYKRAWEKDYFTSALPFPQKGEPVRLPLLGSAGVSSFSSGDNGSRLTNIDGSQPPAGDLQTSVNGFLRDVNGDPLILDNSDTLVVDLSSATALTVEDLRRATRLQEWLEINARSGTRYIESIMSHFGVKSRDSRLQRPEYLGGGKSNISFSEVLQSSSSDAETPQGNMAGHGINVGNTNAFNTRFEEHGFIIGIMSVLPDTAYTNVTPKWATRLDPLEYLWPTFAQLGEQPVYNYEVKGDYGELYQGDGIFGYQSRYADYKYSHNTVHGDFKGNLDFWHLARKLNGMPFLNEEFIQADPSNRIFAVEEEEVHKLYVHVFNRITARRPLPRYNIPTL